MQYNDLTFFTNEPERDLYSRFNTILQNNTQFFDILVGYFRTSGFFKLYPAMQDIEKIRVLVGLNVDTKTFEIIQSSYKEAKDSFGEDVEKEFSQSDDTLDVERGVRAFIEWLRSGKIEMRIYPESPLHAKVYIMRKYLEKSPEHFGSVITGSSNFSLAGLVNNLEFNVELKDSRDVEFAVEKFEELWEKSVDISEVYVDTVEKNTWLRDDISPYELYLKTLYEYFKEEIDIDKESTLDEILPDGFMRLQYQLDAVVEAEKKLEAYGGVFISDVVGLGKTYICAMIAKKAKKGKKLFICPPVLVSYWESVLRDFDVAAKVESLGKLEKLIEEGIDDYKYVFIDEAHRFRNDDTESFKLLHEICYGKKVVLISATPINNYSSDIENQIYLFQPKHNSTITPFTKNLEGFFRNLRGKLAKKERGSQEYTEQARRNSEEIRDKLLRNIMIRRTRREIMDYYADDLCKQGLVFPKLGTPEQVVYTFDESMDAVFTHTMQTIRSLSYARYSPLLYLEKPTNEQKQQMTAQANMGGFMKSILVKRLESSFFAFKNTLGRFIKSYTQFINMCNSGEVYVSKKVNVYDLLDNGDDDKLMELVDVDRVQHFAFAEFNNKFMPALEKDLAMLKRLGEAWEEITADPKLDEFKRELKKNLILKNNKLIIFSESKETASYLGDELSTVYGDKVVVFSGDSSPALKRDIEYSYNPKFADRGEDKYNILITTDVLAEGVNLHRSGVLINYDLPWNPTRIMQRVGRINRVGTEFDRIYVFNFFPTAQTTKHLPLEERIAEKLQAFHDTLGEDFKYLSENEQVTSHKLYADLTAELGNEEVGNPELFYLAEIRRIRDENTPLFDKIKKLPRKAKSGKRSALVAEPATVTFLRRGFLKMFFKSTEKETIGVTFLEAINLLQSTPEEKRIGIGAAFFDRLGSNKAAFDEKLVEEEVSDFSTVTVAGNDAKMIKLLKALSKCKKFTDIQEEVLQKMIELWQNGEIPASITKEALKISKLETDELQLYSVILDLIPERYFVGRNLKKAMTTGEKQVILSCWLQNGGDS
ncbi:MAG: phospholipase D-like domain-containing protein [Defluviitaleaceae bacterium]|nr:phospholipase D-like domain-containing protein [Defluviitaleaceae bacterium]